MAVVFDLPFTQTSTIVAFMITLLAAVVLLPMNSFDGDELFPSLLRLTHLISFATWLGTQVWVTFFAGEKSIIKIVLKLLRDCIITKLYLNFVHKL